MDVFFLILIVLIIYNCNFLKKRFNFEYLDRNNTLCINGIFVLLVFFSHILSYCSFDYSSSIVYQFFHSRMEQLVVVSFLFYSGYGIVESVLTKNNYVKVKLKKRMMKLYLMFIIAILSFLLMNTLLNIHYDFKTIILSFVGWESIGNSNWYVFGIIFMYLFSYVCFNSFQDVKLSLVFVSIFSFLFIYYLGLFKDTYWFNTILCFPVGMWYSFYKDKIKNIFMSDNKRYLLSCVVCLLFFIIFYRQHNASVFFYEMWSIFFMFLVLLVTMKFKINNRILLFFGKYTFWIYILQRIPMNILKFFNVQLFSSYLYVFLCLMLTIFMAIFYDKIFKNIFKNI